MTFTIKHKLTHSLPIVYYGIMASTNSSNIYIRTHLPSFHLFYILFSSFFVCRVPYSLFFSSNTTIYFLSLFFSVLPYVSLCTQKHTQTLSERRMKQTNTVASWFIQPNAQIFGLTVCGCCVCVRASMYIVHFTRMSMREWVNVFVCLLTCVCVCDCASLYSP